MKSMLLTGKERRRRKQWLWFATAGLFAWFNGGWLLSRLDRLIAAKPEDLAGDFGNFFAFNGIVLFTAAVLTGSRNRTLERLFGLDRMLLAHRLLAPAALVSILLHATLRVWSFGLKRGIPYPVEALYKLDWVNWQVTLGRLGLFAMLAAGISGLIGQRFNLVHYRFWKPVHYLGHLGFYLGMTHAIVKGDDMRTWPFYVPWSLLTAVFLVDQVARFRRLLARKTDRMWRIAASTPETVDIRTIHFERPLPCPDFATREPGSFVTLRVPGIPDLNEPHPFTLSGPADSPRLSCSIKAVGDFTRDFVRLPPGTGVLVEGPYGVFLAEAFERPRLGFIAGGVGITPFLSFVRSAANRPDCPEIRLLWAGKNREELFALDELSVLSRKIPLTVLLALSREGPAASLDPDPTDNMRFACGRICPDLLKEIFHGDEAFYFCGPPGLKTTVEAGLHTAFGVSARRIKTELFFW